MRIKNVHIKNFRSLIDTNIDFDEITTFIGPNGVGKSTILHALDWFFNGKPGSLTDRDCSFGDTHKDISVRVTFDHLTEKDREALQKYATRDSPTFTAWKIRNPNGEEVLSANAMGYEKFAPVKSALKAGDRRTLYNSLRDENPDLGLPSVTSGQGAMDAITQWEEEHPDLLTPSPAELQTNFFGFNSQGKMSGLFDFVLVTADLRASEETVDGKASIIGRILERSVDRTAADEEIAKIVERSRLDQQKVYTDKFSSQLEDLDERINEAVETFSHGRKVSVTTSEIELKAPKTTFNVSILDGDVETVVERQGHGFQRTLLIAALQVLADSSAASEDGVICLAIEEPELYQHPIQARAFAKVLRDLASEGSKRIQVTYATHSPYFLESRHFHQVRRLVRRNQGEPGVSVHSVSMEEVKSELRGIVKPKTVESQLDNMARGTLAAALFADRVLLVEGTTEGAVFYGVGDKTSPGSLEAAGLEITPTGSKTNIPLAHTILTKLGIPTFAMFDGDARFEERARAKNKPEDKIVEERKGHVAANKTLLAYFGLEVVDFPDQQVSQRVAILEDHLESHLEETWPEWIAACGELERASGINLAKNHDAYRLATLRSTGVVPELLSEVLSRSLTKE